MCQYFYLLVRAAVRPPPDVQAKNISSQDFLVSRYYTLFLFVSNLRSFVSLDSTLLALSMFYLCTE